MRTVPLRYLSFVRYMARQAASQAVGPHSDLCRTGSMQLQLPLAFTMHAPSEASADTLRYASSGKALSRSNSQSSQCSESSASSSHAPSEALSQPTTPQDQVFVESPNRKRRSMNTRRHRRLTDPGFLGLGGSASGDISDKTPSAGTMRRLQETMIPATLKQLATKQKLRYSSDTNGLSITASRAAVGTRAREYQELLVATQDVLEANFTVKRPARGRHSIDLGDMRLYPTRSGREPTSPTALICK